ncbi:hypothetical protein IL306_009022 [Fusarium sp. DS 682]|nr:hypothetical protein IL306_009022 [Fusarium sp. DS 682]
MKLTTVLICGAGVYRVSATVSCSLINPIAYAACTAGCSAAAVPEDEAKVSPRFQPDGSVVFEKESAQCAGVYKPLIADRLAYSACLAGCAGAAEGEKK